MIMNEFGLSLDTVWMLLAAMLVFWMQPGFALCEAGFTRSKNTANISEATRWEALSVYPTGAICLSTRVTCP